MPVRLSPADQGLRRGRQIVANLCRELDEARLAAGLSFADLGGAAGISGQQAARICRGRSPEVSFVRMASLLAAVGLDLSSRAFPGGLPVRDAAHLALLRRLRARLARSMRWQAEVPVADQTPSQKGATATFPDRRAWDARISGPDWRVGVEAETRLGDIQALERRIALKQRDGDMPIVLLVINDTAHNRRVLADPTSGLRGSFPGSARDALGLLAAGQPPRSSTILVL
jgi:transcriptional regulator with XRE-family HTH domain